MKSKEDKQTISTIPLNSNNIVGSGLNAEMIQAFAETQNKNEMAEVLKELFDEGKIVLIGDLNKDEIKLATRIYMISKLKNIPEWKEGLFFFFKLMLSKNRKSRKEIIEAISGYQSQRGFMDKMNPFNRGGRY